MAPSGMVRRVDLVRTDVLEEFRSLRRLIVTASVLPSSPILVTLMKGALSSFETSVPTRVTRCNIAEDAVLNIIKNFPTAVLNIVSNLDCTASYG
jgi:hypothetical protein